MSASERNYHSHLGLPANVCRNLRLERFRGQVSSATYIGISIPYPPNCAHRKGGHLWFHQRSCVPHVQRMRAASASKSAPIQIKKAMSPIIEAFLRRSSTLEGQPIFFGSVPNFVGRAC